MAEGLPQRKRTMIKNRVGCAKTSTFNLPPVDHVYGFKQPPDLEGAGALISTWVAAKPYKHIESGKVIVYTNSLAVKNGCVTSKTMRQYSKDHPTVRLREPTKMEKSASNGLIEGPFGIKTKFSEEPIEAIIQAIYTNFDMEDQDYPDMADRATKRPLTRPKATIASESIVLARELSKEKEIKQKKRFIMKKFQNVEGVALRILQSKEPSVEMKEDQETSNISEESKH